MTEDRWLERVGEELREYRAEAVGLDARILAAVAASRRPRPLFRFGLLALAAAAAAVIVVVGRSRGRDHSGPAGSMEFSIELPAASQVRLVGDFNDWDRGRTPLVRVAGSDRWRTWVPVPAGLHRYAFLVDGVRWVADPGRPTPNADPDFGQPVSLITVQ